MPNEYSIPRPLLLLIAAWFSMFASQGSVQAEEVDFARDVQPILASRCLKCHGEDEPEGGLRLTEFASATAKAESGQRAIVPGKAAESELLRRVRCDDEFERMPPEGPPLSAAEIAKLESWIAAGANWPTHWSYAPLVRPVVPVSTDQTWGRTPIDAFLLEELRRRNMSPAPAAEKRVLLRRVYFDLIGLPPTPEEMDNFLADGSADAYEKVVDKLLASPHYGERWARHWMDVVHFAETHGHDQDRPREHAWPYRDYLIRSFNEDKPYARFVEEQIAGDVLFPIDPQALVATGLLATGPWDESSLRDIREDTPDREIARYLDRDDIITTVMSTFVSSTVHCARCHDHKFDPISQENYYALQAVFAATDKANRAYDSDAQVAKKRQELTVALADLPQRKQQGDKSLLSPEVVEQLADWEARFSDKSNKWQLAELLEFHSDQGSELTKQEDGALLASGKRPETDTYTLIVRSPLQSVTGFRLEVMTDDSLPHAGPGRQDNGNLHLNEVRAWAMPDEKHAEAEPLTIKTAAADFNQEGWSVEKAIDNNSATAWGIFPEVGKPHQALFGFDQPVAWEAPITLKLELQQTHGDGHLIGRPRISVTGGSLTLAEQAISPAIAAILQIPEKQRTDSQRLELAAEYLKAKWSSELAGLPPQQMVYCGTNQFKADGSFRPAALPRPVHLLKRGNIAEPLQEVEPAALECLPQLPGELQIADRNNEGQRRAALAKWLSDPNNALAWRSIANRVWHFHFGRGIVDTPNDFGRMGSAPTHPRLLDWLAVEFRDSGGSLKKLHRLIVTSSVYRQSSGFNESHARQDGENRYLWRMNRRRLDAESVRDAVLLISGRLDATMRGPSVRQFNQSPGIHVTPNVDYLNFDVDDPANYRRSVYRFVFRTIADPFMEALDCPDSSQLAPVRGSSLTALQALAMLNDKMIVRNSEQIAERALNNLTASGENAPSAEQQVTEIYRLIFSRSPAEKELSAVTAYTKKHGLANASRFLLNTNEFMFVP